jgi:secreted PhoX family phosphatase
MNDRYLGRHVRGLVVGAVSMLAAATVAMQGAAHAQQPIANDLGFTPIASNAQPCSASGIMQFATDKQGNPLTPTVLMNAGEAATPVNAPASSNAVGRENDMIAISPDGRYLFTPSENANPSETGLPNGSDGITRLTLKGPDTGKKEILADDVDASGNNVWQRVDGIKWYGHGPKQGVLLVGEEFGAAGVGGSNGHVWQVDPDTGDVVRIDWLGGYAHEGIGLDKDGNLYMGAEERVRGAIFKAVPNDVNDLTKGGTLYYLVGVGTDPTGWKQVADPANAAFEAAAGGAILFDRPEDFDEANGRIYVAVTEPASDADPRAGAAGQVVNRGGVYSFSTTGVPEASTQSGTLPYNHLAPMIEVNDPKYTSQAQAQAQQGLQFPDNLAFDGRGHLWVHEDIPDSTATFPASGVDVAKEQRNQQDELYVFVLDKAGDQVVANPDPTGPGVSGGYKAADMRTSPAGVACENEFTGGIFGQDGKTLYINQQHHDNPTVVIRIS